MIKVIHVSDLHFGKSLERNKAIGKLLARIRNTYRFDPASGNYLLLTGDLVNDAETKQMNVALKSALAGFAGYLLYAPGNHDYCEAGLNNLLNPDAVRYVDDVVLPTLHVPARYGNRQPQLRVLTDPAGSQVLTVGLNSCRLDRLPLMAATGRIGSGQIAAAKQLLELQAFEKTPTIVYLHHRPQECAPLEEPFVQLEDRNEFLKAISPLTDVIAFGHDGNVAQSTTMVMTSKRGAPIMLNANGAVPSQGWFEITIDGATVSARRVSSEPR